MILSAYYFAELIVQRLISYLLALLFFDSFINR